VVLDFLLTYTTEVSLSTFNFRARGLAPKPTTAFITKSSFYPQERTPVLAKIPKFLFGMVSWGKGALSPAEIPDVSKKFMAKNENVASTQATTTLLLPINHFFTTTYILTSYILPSCPDAKATATITTTPNQTTPPPPSGRPSAPP